MEEFKIGSKVRGKFTGRVCEVVSLTAPKTSPNVITLRGTTGKVFVDNRLNWEPLDAAGNPIPGPPPPLREVPLAVDLPPVIEDEADEETDDEEEDEDD